MLDSLHGKLLSLDEDVAILDVNGVRFRLDVPASTARTLKADEGPVTIMTRLNFNPNEGSFVLFGFATDVERECFDIFTQISGIGPRKGLMILSQVEIASFARAIITNDLSYLSSIKGVGKKTAERLVVELREKMVPYTTPEEKAAASGEAGPMPESGHVRDAVEALVVLGCRQVVAERAIRQAVEELGSAEAPTEELIRAGLRHR